MISWSLDVHIVYDNVCDSVDFIPYTCTAQCRASTPLCLFECSYFAVLTCSFSEFNNKVIVVSWLELLAFWIDTIVDYLIFPIVFFKKEAITLKVDCCIFYVWVIYTLVYFSYSLKNNVAPDIHKCYLLMTVGVQKHVVMISGPRKIW